MLPRSVLPLVVVAFSLVSATLLAQSPKQAADQWRAAHEQEILREFNSLLSIPNVASDTDNIRRNADVLTALLARRHVAAKLLTVSHSPFFEARRIAANIAKLPELPRK